MHFLRKIALRVGATQKKARKTITDYQNELFIQQTKEQFKKLVRFGQLPVTLL